jgi:hypothetical protein
MKETDVDHLKIISSNSLGKTGEVYEIFQLAVRVN